MAIVNSCQCSESLGNKEAFVHSFSKIQIIICEAQNHTSHGRCSLNEGRRQMKQNLYFSQDALRVMIRAVPSGGGGGGGARESTKCL